MRTKEEKEFILQNVETYYKVIALKSMCYWHSDRKTDNFNRIEILEAGHVYLKFCQMTEGCIKRNFRNGIIQQMSLIELIVNHRGEKNKLNL